MLCWIQVTRIIVMQVTAVSSPFHGQMFKSIVLDRDLEHLFE